MQDIFIIYMLHAGTYYIRVCECHATCVTVGVRVIKLQLSVNEQAARNK